jgi:phosphatidylserine decarboxylase
VERLHGDASKGQAERYFGSTVAIFRLAPQDYHHFHSPVDGTIGHMTYIPGAMMRAISLQVAFSLLPLAVEIS